MDRPEAWMKWEYRRRLEEAASTGSAEQIGNKYPWQVRQAEEVLLDLAASKALPVRILCGGIPKEFYDSSMVLRLRKCLDAGCNVKVAVWHEDPAVISPEVLALATEAKEFSLRLSKYFKQVGPIEHFMLIGEQAYRKEALHEDLAEAKFDDVQPEVPARICFNDRDEATGLGQIFDLVWDTCAPLRANGTRA